MCIKAYPDGSFDMRPGFSRPGKRFRFEDEHGVCVCVLCVRVYWGLGEGRLTWMSALYWTPMLIHNVHTRFKGAHDVWMGGHVPRKRGRLA